jgi:hypothetical protein
VDVVNSRGLVCLKIVKTSIPVVPTLKNKVSVNFNPSRGGNAPDHLRDALIDAVEASFVHWNRFPWWEIVSGGEVRAQWLLGQFWNCRDIVPGTLCDSLDLPIGRTFAQLVRRLKSRHQRITHSKMEPLPKSSVGGSD